VERHRAEVARLQDEIGGYLNQIEQAESAVKTEAQKLEKTKSSFEKKHELVLHQIERDVENMHKYL